MFDKESMLRRAQHVYFDFNIKVPLLYSALNYVTGIEGKLWAKADITLAEPIQGRFDRPVEIGSVGLGRIQVQQALRDNVNLSRVCTCLSKSMDYVYKSLFDTQANDGGFRHDLMIEEPCNELLIIFYLDILPKYRMMDIIIPCIERIIRTFAWIEVVVSNRNWPGIDLSNEEWSILKFAKISQSSLVLRDNSSRVPEGIIVID